MAEERKRWRTTRRQTYRKKRFKPTNTETWIGAVQSLYLAYNNHSCFSSVFCFFLSLILVFMQPTLSDEIDRNSNAETTDFQSGQTLNMVSKLNLLHQCAEKLSGRMTESYSNVAVELSTSVESTDAIDMPHRVSLFSRAQLRQHKRARIVHEKNLTPIFYIK